MAQAAADRAAVAAAAASRLSHTTTSPEAPGGASAEPGSSLSAVEVARLQLHNKQVQDGRKRFNLHLEDHVLDFLHNNPINIEACLATCNKMFANVLNHPEEDKFRKVKAASATLRTNVMAVKGGEDLLLHAGWVPRVVDMEKYWLFDAPPGSVRFDVLREALHLCERAQATVHDKAEKKRKEREDKLSRAAAERERIARAIEEDKAERKLRAELTAVTAPAQSPWGQQQQAQESAAPGAPQGASPVHSPQGGR